MKIGFVGAGKMAEAMIVSLLASKELKAHRTFVSDVDQERLRLLKRLYNINVYSNNKVVPGMVDIIFLSVKPQQMDEVLSEIATSVTSEHLVISIAAGKKLAGIQSSLPNARLIRVMPNLACVVGEAMSVFCAGATATAEDKHTALKVLSCFGKVLELPEERFDAVTAVSGSGPAFFAYLLDIMADAGVQEGLNREDAVLLAEQTMLGTARVLIEKKLAPQDLIKSVASAKGTTAAGLAVLEKSTAAAAIKRAIAAAAKRSRELNA